MTRFPLCLPIILLVFRLNAQPPVGFLLYPVGHARPSLFVTLYSLHHCHFCLAVDEPQLNRHEERGVYGR